MPVLNRFLSDLPSVNLPHEVVTAIKDLSAAREELKKLKQNAQLAVDTIGRRTDLDLEPRRVLALDYLVKSA